jgi:hypothetical protein
MPRMGNINNARYLEVTMSLARNRRCADASVREKQLGVVQLKNVSCEAV